MVVSAKLDERIGLISPIENPIRSPAIRLGWFAHDIAA